MLAVRMDEANHREVRFSPSHLQPVEPCQLTSLCGACGVVQVNHTFSALKHDDYNPYMLQQRKNEVSRAQPATPHTPRRARQLGHASDTCVCLRADLL